MTLNYRIKDKTSDGSNGLLNGLTLKGLGKDETNHLTHLYVFDEIQYKTTLEIANANWYDLNVHKIALFNEENTYPFLYMKIQNNENIEQKEF